MKNDTYDRIADIALDSESKGRGFESHCDQFVEIFISFI
jgi:hypothetical protein